MLPLISSHISFTYQLLQRIEEFSINLEKVMVVLPFPVFRTQVCHSPQELADMGQSRIHV